jgi:ankyrin repeat protein
MYSMVLGKEEAAKLVFKSLGFFHRHDGSESGELSIDDMDCVKIVEADETLMMSHILTCLGALIQVKVGKSTVVDHETKIFYGATSNLCQTASVENGNLASELDLALHGAKHSENDGEIFTNVWIPIFWAALIGKNSAEAVAAVLKEDPGSIEKLLPVSNATVGHYAVGAAQSDVNVLNILLEVRPELVFVPDAFGDLMLHYSARLNPRIEVLRYLLMLNPAATRAKGRQGRTPGHILTTTASTSHLVELEFILNQDLSVLKLGDDSGNTPLHLSFWQCWERKLHQIPKLILDLDRDAAFMKNNHDELPLHQICERADLTSAEAYALFEDILELYTQQRTSAEDYFMMICKGGCTPLHRACRNECVSSSRAIRRLLDLCPQTAGIPDEVGSYPLHSFLRSRTADNIDTLDSQATVDALIVSYPAACDTVDRSNFFDKSPLHIASGRWPLSTVQAVLRVTSADIMTSMMSSEITPLLSAVMGGNLEVIKYLYLLYPSATLPQCYESRCQ